MSLYIKGVSVTNAQRARNILQKNSIKAYVQRLENPSPGDGCGYVIKTEDNSRNAKEILEKNGIRVLGVEHR
ncbi:MAG: DUF3343 domain-containing protein [Eubacterium sp.]|nr:DUF3343 domain-containing protein [Eubacterium sp.]